MLLFPLTKREKRKALHRYERVSFLVMRVGAMVGGLGGGCAFGARKTRKGFAGIMAWL